MYESDRRSSVNSVVAAHGFRPFLVGADGEDGEGRITIHSSQSAMTGRQARKLKRQLVSECEVGRCEVKRHSSSNLERAPTLEAFLAPFSHDNIILDPTGAFVRAHRLVQFAAAIRQELGRNILSLYWYGRLGTLYVVLNRKRYVRNDQIRRADLIEAERTVRDVLFKACGPQATEFIKGVRIGFNLLDLPLTPIDNRSLLLADTGLLRAIGRRATASSLAVLVGLSAAGLAQAGEQAGAPAVSQTNAEFAVMGGDRDGEGTFLVEGAVVTPLGQRYGARVEGSVGSSNDAVIGGAGLHLFWRDPSLGLLGVTGGYAAVDPAGSLDDTESFGRAGAEGEIYFDSITLSSFAGYQFSDDDIKDGFVGRLDLEWYPAANLLLTAGGEWNREHEGLGRVGLEYMPGFAAMPGLSLFAEGAIGDHDYERVYGGLRFYFGPSKTLIDRHRYDTFRSNIMSTRMTDTPRETETAPTAAYGG